MLRLIVALPTDLQTTQKTVLQSFWHTLIHAIYSNMSSLQNHLASAYYTFDLMFLMLPEDVILLILIFSGSIDRCDIRWREYSTLMTVWLEHWEYILEMLSCLIWNLIIIVNGNMTWNKILYSNMKTVKKNIIW